MYADTENQSGRVPTVYQYLKGGTCHWCEPDRLRWTNLLSKVLITKSDSALCLGLLVCGRLAAEAILRYYGL